MSISIEQLLTDYPFLTYIKYTHNDYIGVVQNYDHDVISMYAYNRLRTDEDKRDFLHTADIWWWESNRLIPINIFLKTEWDRFRYTHLTLTTKDIRDQQGHVVCLSNLANKRTKRRVLQLVRKLT